MRKLVTRTWGLAALAASALLVSGCGDTQHADAEEVADQVARAETEQTTDSVVASAPAADERVAEVLTAAKADGELPEEAREERVQEIVTTLEEPAPTEPIELTPANFVEKTDKGIILVDFWAPWCSWCLKQMPIVKKLAPEYAGKVAIGTVNTDEYPQIAQEFGVRGLPTLILLKDGKRLAKFEGFRPEEYLRRAFDTALEQK